MATSRNTAGERQLKNRIARAVFSAAENAGISDIQLLEQMTQQVIERLKREGPSSRALPGMEDLVPRKPSDLKISESEIQAKVKQVLAEISLAHVEKQPPEADTSTVGQVAKQQIELSDNASVVLERRYLMKDSDGQPIETPEDMFRRVARHIASAETVYGPQANVATREEEFYQVMANLEFLPNSPTLMNAGRELGQLSACFVLPVDDSMDSIFDAVKNTAMIHKSGGGTGFSFSRIRPENDRVGSTGGVASGPISFIKAFDTTTDVIKQGGMRRGANMGILNVHHPDIMNFITAKEKADVLNNFNISVAATETFMKAVEEDADYELINPRTKEATGTLNAREVFDKIVDGAWRNGEPGLVFLDLINRDNPTRHLGQIESTNPCGEQPLLPFESCNLGSINLAKMIGEENGEPTIDWEKLEQVVTTCVRFLDNVIDVNEFPLQEIAEKTKSTRKIGLGVMGFADMLIRLGIPYDSEEALKTGESIISFIENKATEASVRLAEERGVFPAFEGSIYDRGNQNSLRVRNATRTTIAPTGTLSIIAGCSSGIEPVFALSYFRNILDNDRLVEVNPVFEEVAKKEGFYSDELMETLAETGRVRGMDEIPEWAQRVFATSHDISPEWHVKMQAAFQRHTDNAVSKTINFPQDATREDVANAYLLAYKKGCKGITIYRDRSRDEQVLSIGSGETAEEEDHGKMQPRERPAVTYGATEKVTTGCGNIYVTVNSDERGICEVFASLGKSGGCASAQLEAIGKLISMSLRAGISVEAVVKNLKGIRCPSIAWHEGHAILSCPDAIGGVLERHLSDPYVKRTYPETEETQAFETAGNNGNEESAGGSDLVSDVGGGQCPDCGSPLVYQEGCHICHACGYTKCS